MVTRAKALLIIIGDHETLQQNEQWDQLIGYIIENKSLIEAKKLYPRVQAPIT